MNENKSINSLKKQLVAAVAMVLVAAVALGSSTYAWFVNNSTVTAEGMTVKAQTEAGLAIRFDTGTWATTASAGMTEATALRPASTINNTAWYHASALAANAFGGDAATRTTIASENYGDYMLVKEFQIRSTSDTLSKGLYAKSVTVTKADGSLITDTMNTALRVGVLYDGSNDDTSDDKFVIFAPVAVGKEDSNKPSYTYKVYTGPTDTDGTSVTALAADAGTKDNALLIGESVSIPNAEDSCVKVKVYMWYEGEDHNLYSDNFVAQDLSISVDFSSIE